MNSNQEGTLANFVAVTEAVRRARNDSQLLREVERHRMEECNIPDKTVSPREGGWDFWNDEAKLYCVGYNGQIDYDLICVWLGVVDGQFNSDIAKRLELSDQYVELLQSVFCSVRWANYGTSPRGCWPDEKEKAAEKTADLLRWYELKWGEPFSKD